MGESVRFRTLSLALACRAHLVAVGGSSSVWKNQEAAASSGEGGREGARVQEGGTGTVQNKKANLERLALMLESCGGESQTRTGDLRIMIPSL